MLDPDDFCLRVIRPTLKYIGLWSREAEDLLLGTALVESGLHHLTQKPGGPALGVYQIEPPTHDSLWKHQLGYRRLKLAERIKDLTSVKPALHEQLITNLAYATAMARVRYLPWPQPIPKSVEGQARYWVEAYNRGGKGTAAKYMRAWEMAK